MEPTAIHATALPTLKNGAVTIQSPAGYVFAVMSHRLIAGRGAFGAHSSLMRQQRGGVADQIDPVQPDLLDQRPWRCRAATRIAAATCRRITGCSSRASA